jgi:hypothetical protein
MVLLYVNEEQDVNEEQGGDGDRRRPEWPLP